MHRKEIAQAEYRRDHPAAEEEEMETAPANVLHQEKEEEDEDLAYFV